MAYSNTFNYVVGDTLPELTITLKDKNQAASGVTLDADNSDTWAPIGLAGATVRLRLRALGSTTITDTLSMTVSDATNGVCVTDFTMTPFTSLEVDIPRISLVLEVESVISQNRP